MKALGMTAFAAGLLIVLTARAGEDEAKKDKAALEGTWKVISFETAKGKDSDLEGATLEFSKDAKSLIFTHKDQTKKGTVKINAAAKPKEMDIKPNDEDKTFEAIYHVEKDKLKLCLTPEPGDGRPGEFAVKEGKSFILILLERAK
jgi:uncharacterized protein (TIGR03067 family)